MAADPRHADMVLLQMKMDKAKPLSTPGVDRRKMIVKESFCLIPIGPNGTAAF